MVVVEAEADSLSVWEALVIINPAGEWLAFSAILVEEVYNVKAFTSFVMLSPQLRALGLLLSEVN